MGKPNAVSAELAGEESTVETDKTEERSENNVDTMEFEKEESKDEIEKTRTTETEEDKLAKQIQSEELDASIPAEEEEEEEQEEEEEPPTPQEEDTTYDRSTDTILNNVSGDSEGTFENVKKDKYINEEKDILDDCCAISSGEKRYDETTKKSTVVQNQEGETGLFCGCF